MTSSKEEEIQRCKTIILQLKDTNGISVLEKLALVEETLHLFPRTKEDDALYPVEELIDMYHTTLCGPPYPLQGNAQAIVALHKTQRLAMDVLFEYFERSGPGTAYLTALSLFVNMAGPAMSSNMDGYTRILLKSEAVLNCVDRLAIQHPSDCASMLRSFTKLLNRVSAIPLACKVEYFNKAISLCKKYPGVDSNVLVGLYCFANGLAGWRSGDNVNQASELRAELIRTFLEIKHPDRTKLDVLCAWILQRLGLLFVFMLLPLGLKLAKQCSDRVSALLESVEDCLSPENVRFLLMMHIPDAMQLIEETASPESLPAVKCLLRSLMGDARRQETREIVLGIKRVLLEQGVQISKDLDFAFAESWQRRLILKAVDLFSVPSRLTEPEGAEALRMYVKGLAAYSKNQIVAPLFELWDTQWVDNRYSWTHRYNVFLMVFSFPRETSHVLSLFVSNIIWMHDPSRYTATASTEELKSAKDLLRAVRISCPVDALYEYDVDMMLLMTWLRAPAVVGRLNNRTALTILKTDILHRLAEMLGPKKWESLFEKRTECMLMTQVDWSLNPSLLGFGHF